MRDTHRVGGADTAAHGGHGHAGTTAIIAGAVIAGLASVGYEVLGTRRLGADGFAPVSTLLTVHFLALVIVLIPVEQLVIRRLAIDGDRRGTPLVALTLVPAVAGSTAVVTWFLRDRLFAGAGIYALLVAATVLTHGLFVTGRGHLAGHGRYVGYGAASATASVSRLLLALVIVGQIDDGRWYAAALIVAPLTVLAFGPFGRRQDRTVGADASEARVLGGLMLASATAQAVLLVGPVVAAVLGAEPALVSVVFVTFTLFRAPLTVGANAVARIVGPFTRMAARGQFERLAKLSLRIGEAAIAVGPLAYVAGRTIGPAIVEIIFGPEFRPEANPTGMVAAGVAAAAASLVIGQMFVARGDTGRLADAWLVAAAVGSIALAIPASDPFTRVAVAFLVAEVTALAGLVAASRSTPPAASPTRGRNLYRWAKRAVDIVGAGVLLVMTAPVLAAVALAIRIGNGRPVLLRQERVGRGGRTFAMLKFRTMDTDADPGVFARHLRDLEMPTAQGEHPLAIDGDPRITPLGHRLRRWSLDELPNFINVLRGDMSLVGPRPLLPAEIDVIRHELGDDAATARAVVRPGITGLAQIDGRDEVSLRRRAELDLEYLTERSLALDLWILARTPLALIRHPGD